ncbi:MAG: CsbD family protein [Phycisphaerales bacterium]|nr:CsbD family protein [Phycisphaerales bacterium]
MNWDTVQGNWHRLKGKVKERWGRLTDDEIDRIEGQFEQLAGKIQERYGKKREEAEKEIREFCNTC